MIGATALHTRAPCDECGDVPAILEAESGVVLCGCCDAPEPADTLGKILYGMGVVGRPLCSRCGIKPARLRIADKPVCTWCSSFADGTASSGENVTAAGTSPSPSEPAAVTPLSRDGASHSPIITTGDCPGTELTAPRQATLEPELDSSGLSGPGACGSERDGFGATNSISATALGMRGDAPRTVALPHNVSSAGVDTPSIRDASLEGRGPVEDWTDGCLAAKAVIYPARRGASHRASNSELDVRPAAVTPLSDARSGSRSTPGEKDCAPISSSCGGVEGHASEMVAVVGYGRASSTGGQQARLRPADPRLARCPAGIKPGPQDSIFSCADPGPCCGDLEAIVSDLEANGFGERKNSSTLRVVAASESAANFKSSSVASLAFSRETEIRGEGFPYQ